MRLRTQVALLVVTVAVATTGAVGVPAYRAIDDAVRQSTAQAAEREGAGAARLLAATDLGPDEALDQLAPPGGTEDDDPAALPVAVVYADGARVARPDFPAELVGDLAAPAPEGGTGGGGGDGDGDEPGAAVRGDVMSTVLVDDGTLVRADAVGRGGGVAVYVFVGDDAVRSEVVERGAAVAVAALLVLLASVVVALAGARRLARHLSGAAATADRLGRGDLTARVPERGPVEVRRVAAALNRLAARIDELLASERETAADLSHRLRTPLTALRLDVEALATQGPDGARADLERDVDALERALDSAIAEARRSQREGAMPACDAVAVAVERARFWVPLAVDQGREVRLVVDGAELALERADTGTPAGPAPPTAPVRSAAADLTAALDCLLENVVAHTPEGVALAVVVDTRPPDGSGAVVAVRDRGAGVPPQALVRGRSDRGSTGLGLDIARRCAERSGGSIVLVPPGRDGWAAVELHLGRP